MVHPSRDITKDQVTACEWKPKFYQYRFLRYIKIYGFVQNLKFVLDKNTHKHFVQNNVLKVVQNARVLDKKHTHYWEREKEKEKNRRKAKKDKQRDTSRGELRKKRIVR